MIMRNLYKPTLIKDYGPHKKGEKYGFIDLEGYTNLFNAGYIEDELGLIKPKKETTKKEATKTKKEVKIEEEK
tara:strand:+ start:1682 stop:1900 length:219 start_codon:yes stop_codon:yes gene_type:complete